MNTKLYPNEINIELTENGDLILYIICPNKLSADTLLTKLQNKHSRYTIRCVMEKAKIMVVLILIDLNDLFQFEIPTSKTLKSHPTLQNLIDGKIDHFKLAYLDHHMKTCSFQCLPFNRN